MLEAFLTRIGCVVKMDCLRNRRDNRALGNQYLLRLKNSTWRNRFFAASKVLYGPPKFFPLLETTLYPAFTFLIMSNPVFTRTWPTRYPIRKFPTRSSLRQRIALANKYQTVCFTARDVRGKNDRPLFEPKPGRRPHQAVSFANRR